MPFFPFALTENVSALAHRSFEFRCTDMPMDTVYKLPDSGADVIPFPVAICLSVLFVITAIIRVAHVSVVIIRSRLYARPPPEPEPLPIPDELSISDELRREMIGPSISVIIAILLLGFVSSRSGTRNYYLLEFF